MPDIIHEVNGGFFDSINQDRLYNAAQMSMPYKRIVSDGIFPDENGTPSGDFLVSLSSGMVVLVAPGNALVGGKWAESVDSVEITVAGNSSGYTRIDSIVLRADTSEAVRAVGIVYKQGEEASTPVAPALTNNGTIKELRLADITVPAGTSALSAENIVDQRGTADCPWVHGLIPPTQAQVADSVTDYLEDNPGIFVVDSEFSDSSTNAIQNKVVSAAVGEIREGVTALNGRLDQIEQGGSGLTTEAKQALLALLQKVAYTVTDGQDLYDALDLALNPPAELRSITVAYTQSAPVYENSSLDDLKVDLVVTAHFSNGTTQTVTAYSLSGTLEVGTSTITVTYSDKTATFTTTVSANPLPLQRHTGSSRPHRASD